MPRPNTILFDLDGVLVDACDWHYEALNRSLSEMGFSTISRHDHLSTYNGLPTRIKLDMLGIPLDIAHRINDTKQKHTLDIIRENAISMKDKISLHSYLKEQGAKIACVTNSIRETATAMLVATNQIQYIDLLVSNEDVKRNKPYPDCYNFAIQSLGVDPSLCLCVEDSAKGIEAAEASIAKYTWRVKDTTEVTKENYIRFVEGLS